MRDLSFTLLREAGHDVVVIAEVAKGSLDELVMRRALSERRILITEASDFGELVYACGHSSAAVMLVRFPSRVRAAKPPSVVEAVAKLGARLWNAFTVVEPGRVRIASRPPK